MEAMIYGIYVIAYNNHGHKYILANTSNKICQKNNVEYLIKDIEYFKLNKKN